MTMLHSGGKFSGKAYETSGGLHGVGVSVVNALSERVEVTVWKDGFEWRQTFSRGKPTSKLEKLGPTRKHGTQVTFTPDPVIFGEDAAFKPGPPAPHGALQGLPLPRRRDPLDLRDGTHLRRDAGRGDLPLSRTASPTSSPRPPQGAGHGHARAPSAGRIERKGEGGAVEWAVTWTPDGFGEADSFMPLLLQRRADARGRHARGRPARGPDPRAEGLRRSHRGKARRR